MEKISTQYNQAVQLIKTAILKKQLEAAKAVNRQMLALYYGVGKYISDNTRNSSWVLERLKPLVNNFEESCLDYVAFRQRVSKKCARFMNNGVII